MKKVLSFVLVLAMILGSVSMAFAAVKVGVVDADNTVLPFKDAPTSGVATILRDMGALEGKGEDTVDLKGTLTRAEAATLVVRALGLDDLGKVQQATKFADVKKDAWYSGYVAVAAAQNIIQGRDAKTFAPEESLTLNEAVALICQTLGYSSAHLNGAWPMNYISAAKVLGLFGDKYAATLNYGTALSVATGNNAATREDFIKLLFNALECCRVEYVEDTKGGYVGSGLTNGQAVAVNGVVYSFAGQTLFETITGYTGKHVSDYYKVTQKSPLTAANKFANKFDASAYYGKSVWVIEKAGADKGGIIGIWSTKADTLTGKFVAKRGAANVFTSFVTTDGTEYKLYDSSKDLTDIIASKVDNWYINGAVDTKKDHSLKSTVTYDIAVEYLDTAKTKLAKITSVYYWAADAVDVVNATEAAFLAAGDIVKLNGDAYNLGGKAFAITKAAVNSVKNVYLEGSCVVEGAVTALADIKEGDVVEIYTAENSKQGERIVKIVVTRNTVNGIITKFNSDDSVIIGGTTYKPAALQAKSYMNAVLAKYENEFDISDYATSEFAFYLNAAGQYVAYDLVGVDYKPTYQYGFVTYYEPAKVQGENLACAYINIVVPGEAVAKYNTLSFATTVAADMEDLNDLFEAGQLVKFDVKDGALKSATVTDLDTFATAKKVNANGIVDGYKITENTKIVVKVTDTDLANANPKNYKALSLADVKGKTFENDFKYLAVDYEVKLVVFDGTADAEAAEAYVTFAAFQSYYYDPAEDAYMVTFLTLDGEKTFVAAEADNWTQFSASAIRLDAGNYDSMGMREGYEYDCLLGRDTLENVTFDGTVLKNADKKLYVASNAQTWVLNLVDEARPGTARFAVADSLSEALDDEFANVLVHYDFDGDDEIDFFAVVKVVEAGESDVLEKLGLGE